jgi:hypothetical protein
MSCMIGLCFYLVADKPPNATWKDRIPYYLSAFFNTVTLAAAVLGLSQAIGPAADGPAGP